MTDRFAVLRKMLARNGRQPRERRIVVVHLDRSICTLRFEPQAAVGPQQQLDLRRRIVVVRNIAARIAFARR